MADLPHVPGVPLHLPNLVKRKVAAAILGMSPRWLDGAVKRGEIPVVRCGTAVRFDTRDLAAFIEKHKSSSGPTGNVAGGISHSPTVTDGSKRTKE